MDRFTRGMAMASARHPWRTIVTWIVVLGATLFLGATVGGTFSDDFAAPGSQSARATELLKQNFPEAAKGQALVVLAAADDAKLQDSRPAIASGLAEIAGADHVAAVTDPFTAGTISQDGRIGYAVLTLDAPQGDLGKPAFTVLSNTVTGTVVPGVQVELGGDSVFLNAEESGGHTGIGLLIALLVLLVVFGTLVAAIVPIGLALVSVGTSIGAIMLLASAMDVSVSAIPVAGVVGLGVGIDYALFVVARYRENRAAGRTNQVALANAMGSSGSAVVFAGGTVVIAMTSLAITGVGVLTTIGLSTAIMVLTAVAAAITLLPAVLGLLGDRIDTGKLVRRHPPAKRIEDSGWWRFGHRVSDHPWPYLIGAVVTLAAIAVPAFWMQTAFPAAGDAPTHTTYRQAYDLLDEGFGIGVNAPLLVVVDLHAAGVKASGLPALGDAIAGTPHIASIGEPITSADGSTVVLTALPTAGPADAETSVAIDQVRALIPGNAYVTGITATNDDVNAQLSHTLPIFIGTVLAIAFLLLMLVFRSVLVPLKAAAMNLLSIGVAYGVLVAVFQWGWGASLLGLEGPTPITSIIVVIMFPIVFGLSMDYEVFLLSRIREEYARTGDNAESVARGLAATGRVITSAALIMIAVFLSLATSAVPSLKMLGIGLATAIFVDATLVRMVLVPATMSLLGKANWWVPAWLDRALPHLAVEGSVSQGEAQESEHHSYDNAPTTVSEGERLVVH